MVSTERRLPPGKLPADRLARTVLGQLARRREEVVVRPAPGEDAAVLRFGDEFVVVSSDPITGTTTDLGWLGVHVCCNDLGAMGAEPVALQVVLLLPEGTTEEWLRQLVSRLDAAAATIGVEISGGHTEVTERVREPVFIGTALGKVGPAGRLVTSAGAQAGDQLVVTKGIGLEGTAILAVEAREELERRLGAPAPGEAPAGGAGDWQSEAAGYWQEISVVKDGLVAAGAGATALHDITEGGLYVAVRELAAASRLAFRVYAERLPVRPATRTITSALGLDPLGLVSSGALLIAHPAAHRLVAELRAAGIEATVIGELFAPEEEGLAAGQGLLIDEEGIARPWPVREEDELWRYWARQKQREQ